MEEKKCSRCKEIKPISDFTRRTGVGVRGTYNSWCKPCRLVGQREWRARNPEKVEEQHRRHKQRQRGKYNNDPEFRSKQLARNKAHRDKQDKDVLKARAKACLLQFEYGLTVEEYEQLLDRFGRCCGICGQGGSMHVDHDHATGDIRGILCVRCNTGLGNLGDTLQAVLRAVAYLQADQYRRGHERGGYNYNVHTTPVKSIA